MKPKVRLLEIRLIGHLDDVERSVASLKQTGSVISDSGNYPGRKNGGVKRYLEVIVSDRPPEPQLTVS